MSSVTLSYARAVSSERRRCWYTIGQLCLVVLLLVTGAVVSSAQCSVGSCRTNSISLSTGVQQNTGSLYSFNQWDGFWSITSRPDPNVMLPHGAWVGPAYFTWPSALPGTQWLWGDSTNSTGGDSILGTTTYTTEVFVCNPAGVMANLSLNLAIVGGGRLYINGVLVYSRPFPGIPANPYVNPGVSLLPGVNTISIQADNIGPASGINVSGTLSTASSDLLTRQCGPQYVNIQGSVKDDIDINGMDMPNDPPLGGVQVTLTNPLMGTTIVNTTPTGRYWFRSTSGPGLYTVQVTPLAGYAITYNTTQTLTLAAAASAPGLRTGMTSCAQVCVAKYNDLNCNGQLDPGEPSLAGWTFLFSDGQIATSATNILVCRKVCGLSSLTVTEVIPPGSCWKNTQPGTGSYTINPIPGQSFNLYFGNSSTGTLCITKFNDLNEDGIQQPGDPLLPGWQFTVTSATYSRTVTTGVGGTICIPITCGTYTVTEIMQPGWHNTTPLSRLITVEACATTTATFGNASTGTICIKKFHDLNCDGVYSAPDTLLPNWTFTISNGSGSITVTTNVTGVTCANVTAGTWTICEVLQPGWSVTTPGGLCQTVTVAPGNPTPELYFGNASTGTVCGFKYNDFNNNGTYDNPPDFPLAGWTIELLDAGMNLIASGVTGTDGLYCFENLPIGTYYMREVQGLGWNQTEPVPPFTTYEVQVTPCCYTIFTFGNHQVPCPSEICITKFNDKNCNGVRDGEPILPGWTFALTDAWGATIYVTTGTNGITCATVTAGTWTVCEVQQAGWMITTPDCITVTVSSCEAVSVTFGNSSTGTVCGFKYNDVNNNGTYDPAPGGPDVPMAGWTINLYDDTFTLIASGITGTNGLYCFEELLTGTYYMEEVQQAGWNQTEPVPPFTTYQVEVTPCCYTIFTFGNHQVQCTSAICISKFDDKNCDGIFNGSDVMLPGWTFTITNGIVTVQVTTNSAGVTCANVPPGVWTVCEVLSTLTCWKPTTPPCQLVTVSSCATTQAWFGNSSTGTLCISKFNDVDGDGTWDPGELGIPGWQFQVSGIGTVVTGTNGTICIPVTCGTYTVCEVLLLGWAPTTPTCATVTVTACETSSVTFGNKVVNCTTQICVVKFNDKNCDGAFNTGDELMPGWTIVVSLPGGGPIVATGVTGTDGSVCIPVTAGTYEVREVMPAVTPPACGWIQTYPSGGGFHLVTITTCGTKSVQFGNSSTGTLCIRKFNDVNCNGIWDSNELGIPGWRFTLTLGTTQVAVVTGTNGIVCVPVTCGTWTVCEQKLGCWVPTTQSGLCQTIFVPACGSNTATFGNSSTGTVCISKFNDLNGDGKWTPGEPGIPGWVFNVSNGVGTVVTSTGGTVCIRATCGTYTICEVLQPGWTPTTPVCTTITVTPCVAVNVTFGNHQTTCTAMICGKKYWERPHGTQNCNGVIDPDEVGMWGYTITIEDAVTGVIVTSGTTAPDGSYCLTVPAPGTYRVREVAKWGFQQTFPLFPAFYPVNITQCGQVVQGLNFLNCACPNDPCVTDSIPIQSRPGAFNGRTVLVVDPSGGPVPRLGVVLPAGVPNPLLAPVGTSQWIGPNACMFPPCNDPLGTYIWRRYFCLCSGIDSTVVRVRLCFEGVNRVEVWLSGKRLGIYLFPNGPTCIDTLVAVGRVPCPYLEFRVTRTGGVANPAALSYQGSLVGPGLVKDSCCNCYLTNGGVIPGGGGGGSNLTAPDEDEDHSNFGTPGDNQTNAGKAVTTEIYGKDGQWADPLLKSVPNPTSGETTVSYLLSQAGEVRLDLYSAVGRHVSTLEQGYRDAGAHSLPVDLTELPSGFYHVRLSINGRVYTLKIMSNK